MTKLKTTTTKSFSRSFVQKRPPHSGFRSPFRPLSQRARFRSSSFFASAVRTPCTREARYGCSLALVLDPCAVPRSTLLHWVDAILLFLVVDVCTREAAWDGYGEGQGSPRSNGGAYVRVYVDGIVSYPFLTPLFKCIDNVCIIPSKNAFHTGVEFQRGQGV